jgi:hypothetical protein
VGSASRAARSPRLIDWKDVDVATLRIDLQGGFDGETVELWVDEELRHREEEARTNVSVDLAASVPLEVPEGPVDVRIVLPARGLDETVETIVAGDTYVVARLERGRLVAEQLAEAPYYL